MTKPLSAKERAERRLSGALRPSVAHRVIRERDLAGELVLYPERVPVQVVGRVGARVRVRLLGGDEFNVRVETLGIA
jgi:hypothetical protein